MGRGWSSGPEGCMQHPHSHLHFSISVGKLAHWGVSHKKPQVIGTLMNWKGESR